MTPKTKIEALEPVAYLHNMVDKQGVHGTIVLSFELKIGAAHKWPNGAMATVTQVFPLLHKGEVLACFKDHA